MSDARRSRSATAWVLCLSLLGILQAGPAAAGLIKSPGASDAAAPMDPPALAAPPPTLDIELLAKAEPDECYNGLANSYPAGPPCGAGAPKVNQAYVWGLAKTDDNLWFGTAPNVHCLVLGGYLSLSIPHETPSWVCEFGDSQYSPPLPEIYGDWRVPHLYRYNLLSGTLTEIALLDPRVQTSTGIRSGGAADGVVFLGGPDLVEGINLFAFDANTLAYLGSANLPEYNNIRKWLVVDGVLYTAVRSSTLGGNVLRWTGNRADPFQFEVVGNLDSEGAELALHNGQLFVSTWPDLRARPFPQAGLYMSPPISAGGLTAADADGWLKVWQASDYEPDPVTALVYGGGALASYDGYLYWGTMNVPLTSALAYINFYGQPATTLDTLEVLARTHRAISIFRGRHFATDSEEIDLLYGEEELWAYVVDSETEEGDWQLLPNNMKTPPKWGGSGFNNPYNNYTWAMAVFEDQLFVGTMDWSYLMAEGLPVIIEVLFGFPVNVTPWLPLGDLGADLWRFPSSELPAIAESTSGVGNYSNYGVRTMIADDALYIGSANPMNLLTDPNDELPEGGWELLRLTPKALLNVYLPLLQISP